jgi:GNAT superfamily N-acetyltransferase
VSAWQHAYDGFISGRLLKDESATEAATGTGLETDAAFVSEGSCSAGYSAETVGLYIRPEFQGSGIGSRLLTEMKAFFRRRGCGRLIIWTLLGVRNNEFYLKHGGSPL